MKELHARAGATVPASGAQALALLQALEGYPDWYPDGVRSVKVLEHPDGQPMPSKVFAVLHIHSGPLTRDFRLTLNVTAPSPSTVKLERIPHEPSDEERF